MNGEEFDRYQLEKEYQGVHEFRPEYRGPCYTEPFTGNHPQAIESNIEELKNRINREMQNENSLV